MCKNVSYIIGNSVDFDIMTSKMLSRDYEA